MSEKSYIHEKAKLKKIKEQKRVAKILHSKYFSVKKFKEEKNENFTNQNG